MFVSIFLELILQIFFEQWIYNEYYPQYGLLWNLNELDELIITVHQLQNWQYFDMPIEIKVILTMDTFI